MLVAQLICSSLKHTSFLSYHYVPLSSTPHFCLIILFLSQAHLIPVLSFCSSLKVTSFMPYHYQVHRLILAMSSPVFESMLYGASAIGSVIHLPEDSPEGFRWVLDYIYCDETHFGSVSLAVEVSHLASKYEITGLEQLCSEVRGKEELWLL